MKKEFDHIDLMLSVDDEAATNRRNYLKFMRDGDAGALDALVKVVSKKLRLRPGLVSRMFFEDFMQWRSRNG